MNKNKIISLLLSGAMLATISGTTGAIVNNRKASNTSTKNITLLANNNQVSSTGYACVINGNNKLVLTNKQGQVISYLSVGEMLHIGQVSGNNTFVTVKSTGASGYIANVNMLNINNSTTNNITRMNRNGYVINVSSSVNLRQGPGMNTNVIEGLSNNTSIRITGKTGQWFRVSVNGTKGYIFEEYIAESNATANVNPTTTVTTPVNVINTSNPNNKTTVTKTSAVINHGELQPNVPANPVTNHGELQPNVPANPVTNHGELQPNVPANPVTNHGELQPNVPANPVTNHGELQPNVPGKPMTNHGELQPNGTQNKPETKPNKPEVKPNKPETKPNKPEVKPNKPETKPNKPEVKPNKPVQKLPAPVIEGNNVTITEGQQFNNSMLNVTANENAKITFNDNNINTNVPGVYTINVTATNSQGTASTKAFTVTVQEGAPTLTVQNVTITQGQTFNDSMLNAKASEGAKIVFNNLEFNANVPATYTIKVTATNNDGLSTVKYAEVTVKAKENSNYITGTVNSNAPSNIPVRSGNGTWAAPIQNVTVNPNQQVNIICNMNGWYKINDNGIIGFVPAIYVTPQGNVPNVSNVYNNSNSTKIANPYNYTLPEYVSAELNSYMSVAGKNLSKDQINSIRDQLTSAINPKAATTMFEFLDVAQYRAVNETLLSNMLSNQGVLSGQAQTFINAAKEYNIDPLALVAQAMIESGHGTSQLATGVQFKGETVYNLFGINAVNADPKEAGATYAYNHGWTSVSKAIYGAAQFLSTHFYHNSNIPTLTPYGLRYFNGPINDLWHQYSTDISYAQLFGTLLNQYSYLYDANDTFTFRVPEFQNTQQMQQLEAQDMMAIKSGNQN